MKKTAYFILCPALLSLFMGGCKKDSPDNAVIPPKDTTTVPIDNTTFTNPILAKGADPWVTMKDGTYYYTYTQGSKLVLYPTKKNNRTQ